MDLESIRLTKANDHDACVLVMAALRKTLVGGDQRSLFGERQSPQLYVAEPLLSAAANVLDVVPSSRRRVTVIRGMFSSTRMSIRQSPAI
jgi:hypothetical protein